MEPTKEQIQWLWEQCGFKESKTIGIWWYPAGGASRDGLPPIDLKNLFKYAVPKLNERGLRIRLINQPIGRDTFFCAVGGKYLAHEWAEDKDLTLALFWAIYKAFEALNDRYI